MHSDEIKSLAGKIERLGYTLVPLKIYEKGNLLKVELGLAKGKKKREKKQDLIIKQEERETQKTMKELNI